MVDLGDGECGEDLGAPLLECLLEEMRGAGDAVDKKSHVGDGVVTAVEEGGVWGEFGTLPGVKNVNERIKGGESCLSGSEAFVRIHGSSPIVLEGAVSEDGREEQKLAA